MVEGEVVTGAVQRPVVAVPRLPRPSCAPDPSALDARELRRLVATAVDDGRLRVVYQPLFDLRTGEVLGAEALLRLAGPDGTTVPPDVFVPVAEESGAIHEMGAWVLFTAAAQCAAWKAALPSDAEFCIGVNLSPRQLEDPGLTGRVSREVAAAGLDPSALVLELTEQRMTEDREAACRTLAALRSAGSHIAVDDFGTGYASLAYLLDFPVDVLKLDRSLTRLLGQPGQPGRVASAAARLTTSVGMVGIAEGVETEAERAQALAHGFTLGQGYLMSRPLAVPDFTALLAEQQPVACTG